jgi:peptide/nickel transport system permease protein
MFKYLIKRLLQMIPILIGMTFISFVVIKLAPGDYLTQLELNPSISKETIEKLRKMYGLDPVSYTHLTLPTIA